MSSTAADASEMQAKLWLPLESNPELLNTYSQRLGLSSSEFQFHDVYGTDPDLLAMVPSPVLAVLLLFPCTEASGLAREEEAERIARDGQVVDPAVYFCKQTVGNACGTIAILHSLMNNSSRLTFTSDSFLDKFLKNTISLAPSERADALNVNDDIEVEHQAVAEQGDSRVPDLDDDVNLHFIAFVNVGGHLYEMDGTKEAPINHGPTSEENLLADSVAVVRQFMARDPDNVRFNMVALAKVADEDE